MSENEEQVQPIPVPEAQEALEAQETNESQEAQETIEKQDFKHSGFFPGVFETVFFLGIAGVLTTIQNMINKRDLNIDKGDGFAVFIGLFVVFGLALFVLGRRHKKRKAQLTEYPNTVRVRDLAIMGWSVMFANSAALGLASSMSQMQQAGFLSLALGFVGICMFSKVWSILGGPKSNVWGGLFILGSLASFYMFTQTVSLLWSAIVDFEPKGEVLGVFSNLFNPLFLISWYLLQTIAFLYGGLGLFKEREERGDLELKFIVFFKFSVTCMGLFTLFLLFTTIPKGLDNPKFPEQLFGATGFSVAMLSLLLGNRMKKHYNETFAQADVLKNLSKKLNRGLFAATLLSVGLGFVVTEKMMESFNSSSDDEVTTPYDKDSKDSFKDVMKEAPGSKKAVPPSKKAVPPSKKLAPSPSKKRPSSRKK